MVDASFDPTATAAGQVFGKDVPDFVVGLSQNDAARADHAKERATNAAAKKALGEPVVASLADLLEATRAFRAAGLKDRKARDAYEAKTATLNRALAKGNQPFFVDADFVGNARSVSPVLLGFYVQAEAQVEGAGSSERVVHLWRLDKLNLNQGYYGYTRPSTPAAIVLLDQIESDLVRDVLPALPDGEPMRLVDEETELQGAEWVAKVNRRGAKLVRSYFAEVPEGRDEGVRSVAKLLARRRALVDKWRRELAGLGKLLVVPQRLVPEADYSKELSLRVPRAGLHEWDELHDELLTKSKLAAFERLRDHYVASVERHEVQHRLDYRRDLVPVPPMLVELLGVENPLDAPYGSRPARSRDEMSSFLASLIDSGPSPALELALMARHAFTKHSLGNAYSYAVLAAFMGIARELKIDTDKYIGRRRIRRAQVAKLFIAITDRPAAKIRQAARRFLRGELRHPLAERENRVVEEERSMATLTRIQALGAFAASIGACALTLPAYADTPVIAAGREADVMALFRPYTLGAAVTPQAKLWNVRVEPERIVVEIEGAAKATFRLEHPDRSPGTERSKSFTVHREPSATTGAGKEATDLLVARVRANDTGQFWDRTTPDPEGRPAAAPPPRFRGIWIPIVVTFVAAAAAIWVSRRRGHDTA